ncbi:MAG: Maf family protein [bacterium]|nr:Maf family protein [bacterium]
MKIILGSQSASRKKILEEHGVVFETMSPDIDEKAIRDVDPKALVLKLAHAKADALLPRILEPSLLITSDQVVVCNGEILEKPESHNEERRFLHGYAYYPPETFTSIVVTHTQSNVRTEGVSIGKVTFRSIPENIIDAIVKDGTVFIFAGGFDIESPLFIPYIEKIEGDPEGICGLPWQLTKQLLDELA